VEDGQIFLFADDNSSVSWDGELGFDGWIFVVGDLGRLRSTGEYIQDEGYALVDCNPTAIRPIDGITPAPGEGAFFLTGGMTTGAENGFGARSDGTRRIDLDVCP
jgi:hypothetical protein